MITIIEHNNQSYKIDLSKPLDISIPLRASQENVNAWYIDGPRIEPVTDGEWIGKVSEGASTNFNNIYFNPHGHGTHTECVGHITPEFYSINDALKQFFFIAEVISVQPKKQGEDHIITKDHIETAITSVQPEALIIRTLPNTESKCNKHYSNTNWPYLTEEAARYIKKLNIEHLLIDLPSVDKEKDDGKLLAHKAFWGYPEATRHNATITEMIYVDTKISDGQYLLNLQIASFVNDASPSKPVLYKML
ncbi:kynurenine formamidase [Aquimarina sp. MAR_2010_214]|uniref:cyclase family protein n=1 Tax=Aquimarina sp. MAR_2010_214 TaxID=1250026 RepID=UPI000C701B25|nr:cyclase family protein [Aquimarina sp. MAR_2010_214]PKV48207.1 kynurenine formamidase [Aquimarina sp. MAR_2010_214]